MRDGIDVEFDYRETFRRMARMETEQKRELGKIVLNTSNEVKRSMQNIVRREGFILTGGMLRSISQRKTRPKAYKPIPKDERNLFRSVHPRNAKGGRPSSFVDGGTRLRQGRGLVLASDFRERARQGAPEQTFNRKVKGVIDRDVQL